MKKNIFFLIACAYFFNLCAFEFVSNKACGALSESFLSELVATFKANVFVETGTFDGKTALNAAQFFDKVYTVELSENLFHSNKKKLVNANNIYDFCDRSSSFIKNVIPNLANETIIFWLDAHYSGGNTVMDGAYNNSHAITAIREELKAIAEINCRDAIILIDDIRGFGSMVDGKEYMGCWAYPTVQEVQRLGKEINPNFECMLLGDMLLMFDATRYTPIFSPIVEACTKSRFYDGTNMNNDALLKNESIIMQAKGEEKKFIENLYNCMISCKDSVFHHDLWAGLVWMGSGSWQKAKEAMGKVSHRVQKFSHERKEINLPIDYLHPCIQCYLSQIDEGTKGFCLE